MNVDEIWYFGSAECCRANLILIHVGIDNPLKRSEAEFGTGRFRIL
jgi:hypothetical protein